MAECNRAVPVKADRSKVLLVIFGSFLFHLLNDDHNLGHFYHLDAKAFQSGGLGSLTLLPTDQILLAECQGVILHASGLRVDGKGLLFVGHSGWASLLSPARWEGGARCCATTGSSCVFGRAASASTAPGAAATCLPSPLRAILLFEQDRENQLIRLEDRRQIVGLLPSFMVRPLVDAGWWVKILDLVGQVAREVPFGRSQEYK